MRWSHLTLCTTAISFWPHDPSHFAKELHFINIYAGVERRMALLCKHIRSPSPGLYADAHPCPSFHCPWKKLQMFLCPLNSDSRGHHYCTIIILWFITPFQHPILRLTSCSHHLLICVMPNLTDFRLYTKLEILKECRITINFHASKIMWKLHKTHHIKSFVCDK